MLYLGPEKYIKGWENIRCRVLYADTYHEILNTLHKLGRPVKYIKRHSNYYSYILSSGYAWQLIRLRDQGFIKLEEMTLMQETDFITTKDTKRHEEKIKYSPQRR